TFAYLQANTDDVVNEFATNQVMVDLKESTDGKYNIVPGTSEFKDPTVTVTSTVPAYVYVEVTDNTDGLVDYAVESSWQLLDGYENIYYREIDASTQNAKYEVLKNNTVSYSEAIVNSDMLIQNEDGTYSLKEGITLSFKALAIQKEPFNDAIKAYLALNGTEDKEMNHSVSEISEKVFGENGTQYLNGYSFDWNTEGSNTLWDSYSVMRNYNTYVIPIEELGLTSGDTLYITNSNNDDYIFTLMHLKSNWANASGGSVQVLGGNTGSMKLTDSDKYIFFQVLKQSNPDDISTRVKFDKSDIPINDLSIYKNEISDAAKLDYISVWDSMITYDENYYNSANMKFGWHNVDADLRTNLLENSKGFNCWDVDLRKTSDGYWINSHNLSVSELVIADSSLTELKAVNSDVMSLQEILSYAKANDIYLRLTDNTIRIGESAGLSSAQTYSQDNIDNIYSLVDEYGMKSNVTLTAGYFNNYSKISVDNINTELWNQTKALYDTNLSQYKSLAEQSNSFCATSVFGSNAFTVDQIEELYSLGINVGMGSFHQSMPDIINFFKNYNSVVDKLFFVGMEESSDIARFIAASRFAEYY
ncbi:MAG: hypothetical protein NC548_33625, partial [Lachnospiraceae bacterium]|nr:hypothetical protein [Lachnospiraceae bacterium]